ncbi:hypothetical protein ACFQDE_21010 [Deinococcus caeni]|uniref:Uncharacterized protein n=1 Tax=Deinococcus caeni TaxID=569127 RepID=A0ABP9UGC7_9DEIO
MTEKQAQREASEGATVILSQPEPDWTQLQQRQEEAREIFAQLGMMHKQNHRDADNLPPDVG